MPVTLTYPGVYIEEVPSGVRTIAGVATSIGLFIGWSARGAIARAVRLTSFSDYVREYGDLDPRSFLGYAVKQFFENGGSDCYVIRLTAADSETAAVTISANLEVSASSPGEWANIYRIRTTQRADDPSRFRLEVLDSTNNNAVVETFENLSMTDTDPRFIANVITDRSSRFIRVAATNAAAPPTLPAIWTVRPPATTAPCWSATRTTSTQLSWHASASAPSRTRSTCSTSCACPV
jgi:phage tail sheath protein FI